MNSPHDLKSAGLKATLPRIKIINLFETTKVRHLTAEDVYKQLLSEGLDIGLATVYRVLTQFEQAGLLVRHHFESGKAVFELNEGKHHDHLVCMQCGRVEEFYDAEIEKPTARSPTARTRRAAVLRSFPSLARFLATIEVREAESEQIERRKITGRASDHYACQTRRFFPQAGPEPELGRAGKPGQEGAQHGQRQGQLADEG